MLGFKFMIFLRRRDMANVPQTSKRSGLAIFGDINDFI